MNNKTAVARLSTLPSTVWGRPSGDTSGLQLNQRLFTARKSCKKGFSPFYRSPRSFDKAIFFIFVLFCGDITRRSKVSSPFSLVYRLNRLQPRFYQKLHDLLRMTKRGNMVILAGDMNAWLGLE